ncbi:MAG: 3-isopropylmalate dehydrogenase [Bacteroidetes bacterium]|nr:3-isopropylmalate dehydrogenase [Bacteroidota bacterium]
MKNYQITLLPGDGIGPEVIAQAVKCLHAAARRFDFTIEFAEGIIGAAAIRAYGEPLPEHTKSLCFNADAILLGAVGHPDFAQTAVRPEQGLLELRKMLELFANIRPVKTNPALASLTPFRPEVLEGVDMIILRELTGGLYYGKRGNDGETAFDTCQYSRHEISRIARKAFELALRRRKKLTLVDKANVLDTSQLWREVVKAEAANYPEVKLEFMYVDNAAMQLIRNPSHFDVMLTENMFGDILSDEASMLAGSLGILPSASEGEHTSLYEPVHGSYPEAAGKDIANPVAAILSAAMLLRKLGETKAANAIEDAIEWSFKNGVVTADLDPNQYLSCSRTGDLLALHIEENGQVEVGHELFSPAETMI